MVYRFLVTISQLGWIPEPPEQDLSPPSIPANIVVGELTETTAFISWSDSIDNVGLDYYEVSYMPVGGIEQRISSEETFVTLTSLQRGLTYNIRVRAFDINGNVSDFSATYSFTTLYIDNQDPTIPENFAGQSNSTSTIDLAWNPSIDDVGIDRYEIEYTPEGGSPTVVSVVTTMTTLTGLLENTTYNIRIRAVDTSENDSEYSAPISVTTQEAVVASNDLALMNARVAEEGRADTGRGFAWEGRITTLTSQQLIDDQAANPSGSFYLNGDPIPSGGPNEETQYWLHRQLRTRIKKMFMIFYYGDYEPARQGDQAVADSAWLALKWLIDNISSIKHFWRGSWTPYAVFTPKQIGYVFAMAYYDLIANPASLIGGETKLSIFTRWNEEVNGSDGFTRNPSKIPWSLQVTHNSYNNHNGTNLGQKVGAGQLVAVPFALYSNNDAYLLELKAYAETLFTEEWGLKYYDFSPYIVGWQDADGLVPYSVITNHNDVGQEDSRARYSNTYMTNLVNWFAIADTTQYNLSSAFIQVFVNLFKESIKSSMNRANQEKMFGGRRFNTQNDPFNGLLQGQFDHVYATYQI